MSEILIDKLTEEILKNEYFHNLLDRCSTSNALQNFPGLSATSWSELTDKELKDALRFADLLSNSSDSDARSYAYQIVTDLNPSFAENPFYKTVAKAVYSKLGNYPAINFLSLRNGNEAEIPFDRLLQSETKKLLQAVPFQEGLYFTDTQFKLYSRLIASSEFSFSGPTSMGKSFIIKTFIKNIIRNSPRENLVILVPTRALINQFTIDLKKDLNEDLNQFKYKVITNSNVTELTEDNFNYIMVLTPERLISFLSNDHQTPVGFLFVDEAHKLAQIKDTRSVTTYMAIEKSLFKFGRNLKLYFSSPNVSNPEIFLSLFNRNANNFFKTTESPVTQKIYFVDLIEKSIEKISKDKIVNKQLPFDDRLVDINSIISLLGRDQNNLIYNNSKTKTINTSKSFADTRKVTEDEPPEVSKAISQIREYVHPDYYLAELISKGVAYHHGKLPQLIRNIVEILYKNENVKYVFCTSTLLEGVNMPTKNLFVLNNQNGRSKLQEIDFWNLVGRAGRLNVELSGNIYCVRHDDCNWDNREKLFEKGDLTIVPTVTARIDKNLKKIEKILQEQDISGPETEQDVLKYIANIISIDTLQLKGSYQSPLITKLIEEKKDKIIELAKSKVQNINVPFGVLNGNASINISIQEKVYNQLLKAHQRGEKIVLPSSNSDQFYETCLALLEKFHQLYEWHNAEKKLRSLNSMSYYAMLMNKWISGFSLSQIIQQSLDYYETSGSTIEVDHQVYLPFEKGNIQHINIVIENIIEDLEYVLRFLLEKYFNHYYQVLIGILGEENAAENWSSLLEYGTQNRIVIALQNIGLSRHTAIAVYSKGRNHLVIEEKKLKSVDKQGLLKVFKVSSIEYDEILHML
ncbi:DEAD/DEAH box helicase [Pedobacter chitinilyticus]|uniref:DEAD/DEAH box helicase n=1 Tax=Pedobacter chitinilyticus TaxID=2233776 RepID=A0A3S3PUB7_9SPHI|nr:DEAD/DEAH box helicase [Pedobacter chitinilyticus]RWU08191.1 DEAD/DEAH box helicase [Pedobacter chitinilyticus]